MTEEEEEGGGERLPVRSSSQLPFFRSQILLPVGCRRSARGCGLIFSPHGNQEPDTYRKTSQVGEATMHLFVLLKKYKLETKKKKERKAKKSP